jgi:hypothetical protein
MSQHGRRFTLPTRNGKPAVETVQLDPDDNAELVRLKEVTEDCAMESQQAAARVQLAQTSLNAFVLKMQRKYGLSLGDQIAPDGIVTKVKA